MSVPTEPQQLWCHGYLGVSALTWGHACVQKGLGGPQPLLWASPMFLKALKGILKRTGAWQCQQTILFVSLLELSAALGRPTKGAMSVINRGLAQRPVPAWQCQMLTMHSWNRYDCSGQCSSFGRVVWSGGGEFWVRKGGGPGGSGLGENGNSRGILHVF